MAGQARYQDDRFPAARRASEITDWLREREALAGNEDRPAVPSLPEPAKKPNSFTRLTAAIEHLHTTTKQPDIDDCTQTLSELVEARLATKRERVEAVISGRGGPMRDVMARFEGPIDQASEASSGSAQPSLRAAVAAILARQQHLDDEPVPPETTESAPLPYSPAFTPASFAPFRSVRAPGTVQPAPESAAPEATKETLQSFFAAVEEHPELVSPPASASAKPILVEGWSRPAQPDPMAAMELAVERLAQQFEKTATRSFDSLERCLGEVMRTIENSRTLSVEAAEAAAEKTIRESLSVFNANTADRIEEIARGLADLRIDANAHERRTCEMLQAVRETLEHVAARLPERAANMAETSESSLIARARAAAAQAAESGKPQSDAPGAERQRFIATARRSREQPRPVIKPVETRLDPIGKQKPILSSGAQKKLLFATAAAVMFGGVYAGVYQMLGSNLPGPAKTDLASTDDAIATNDASSFTTADSGAPNSYRPQDLALADAGGAETNAPRLNAPSPLASDLQLADPVITGSIPKPQASLDPPPEAIGSPRLRASALAGDPAAEFEIAMRLAEGRGVARDPAKAAAWFERAASQGLVPAQYRLGSMTEKGLGRPKDLNAARELYEQAAGRGNVQAMHNLGVLHAEGGLGAPDMATALAWFQEAAAHGVKDSQFNLGVIYTRGLASPQDLPEAYLWFALAAQQGDKDAAGKRDQIAAKLKSQELETAKKMVAEWKAQPVDRTANEVAGPPGGWDDPVTGRASTSENTRIR